MPAYGFRCQLTKSFTLHRQGGQITRFNQCLPGRICTQGCNLTSRGPKEGLRSNLVTLHPGRSRRLLFWYQPGLSRILRESEL